MISIQQKTLVEVKKLFFDKELVKSKVSEAARKALNRIGGMIRLTARRSIRNAPSHKTASRPGSPPLSHTGLLKKNIFYGYDPAKESVVVGAITLNGGKKAQQTLEFGGNVRTMSRKQGKVANVYIKPRPYMYPALEKNQESITKVLRNSVRS